MSPTCHLRYVTRTTNDPSQGAIAIQVLQVWFFDKGCDFGYWEDVKVEEETDTKPTDLW